MNRRDFLRQCAKIGTGISAVAILLNLGIGEPLIENCTVFDKGLSEKEIIFLSHGLQSTDEWINMIVVYDKEGLVVAQYKKGILQSNSKRIQLQTRSSETGCYTISCWIKAA